mmetsp:Transcript_28241/g.66344  ORF Transcript_28241/g.66344 Transcript_28241/m.66344 type:complete len:230 (-) Transcript_28241:761-1450(-)
MAWLPFKPYVRGAECTAKGVPMTIPEALQCKDVTSKKFAGSGHCATSLRRSGSILAGDDWVMMPLTSIGLPPTSRKKLTVWMKPPKSHNQIMVVVKRPKTSHATWSWPRRAGSFFGVSCPNRPFSGCDSDAAGDIISLVGLRGELKSFVWLLGLLRPAEHSTCSKYSSSPSKTMLSHSVTVRNAAMLVRFLLLFRPRRRRVVLFSCSSISSSSSCISSSTRASRVKTSR